MSKRGNFHGEAYPMLTVLTIMTIALIIIAIGVLTKG